VQHKLNRGRSENNVRQFWDEETIKKDKAKVDAQQKGTGLKIDYLERKNDYVVKNCFLMDKNDQEKEAKEETLFDTTR